MDAGAVELYQSRSADRLVGAGTRHADLSSLEVEMFAVAGRGCDLAVVDNQLCNKLALLVGNEGRGRSGSARQYGRTPRRASSQSPRIGERVTVGVMGTRTVERDGGAYGYRLARAGNRTGAVLPGPTVTVTLDASLPRPLVIDINIT